MDEDTDSMAPAERQRLEARAKKRRPGRMVVVNPGMKKLLVDLGQAKRPGQGPSPRPVKRPRD